MPRPEFDLDHIFSHHAPSDEQVQKYLSIRAKARELAAMVFDLVPAGADQSAAVRMIRETVMTANAGIALGGRLHLE